LAHNWGNAAFAGFNAFLAAWAMFAYIGLGSTIVDVWLGLTDWMYVEVKSKTPVAAEAVDPSIDWRSVLYHGDNKGSVPLGAHSHVAVSVEERVVS